MTLHGKFYCQSIVNSILNFCTWQDLKFKEFQDHPLSIQQVIRAGLTVLILVMTPFGNTI